MGCNPNVGKVTVTRTKRKPLSMLNQKNSAPSVLPQLLLEKALKSTLFSENSQHTLVGPAGENRCLSACGGCRAAFRRLGYLEGFSWQPCSSFRTHPSAVTAWNACPWGLGRSMLLLPATTAGIPSAISCFRISENSNDSAEEAPQLFLQLWERRRLEGWRIAP